MSHTFVCVRFWVSEAGSHVAQAGLGLKLLTVLLPLPHRRILLDSAHRSVLMPTELCFPWLLVYVLRP